MTAAPDAQPPAEPHVIPPIPELYWDGIQFYLPAKDDDGTDGFSVMYLSHGSWAYQGWVDAPSEDCPVVPVVAASASAALDGTPRPTYLELYRAIADPGSILPRGDVQPDGTSDYSEPIPSWSARAVAALLASTPTRTEET